MALTPAERRALKAQAHALSPLVLIGNNGLTAAVLKELDACLRRHELVKVRIAGEDRDSRQALLETICKTLEAEPVQAIGRMIVVFRENPDEPKASPPARQRKGPRATKRSFQGS
jgi:putative YhbY family RNA-binding protein